MEHSHTHVRRILTLLALSCPLTAQLEPIDPTFWNVRGFNYIATYRDIAPALGITDDIPISDVASAVAMWRGFDPSGPTGTEVQAQLQRVKDIGANTIRVWLSYHLYHFSPNEMRTKLGAFLGMCDTIGLHVIPILWDNDFEEPDYSSVEGVNFENFKKWIRSPGSTLLESLQGVLTATMTSYVNDMVAIGASHPSLLMWNVMNEPGFGTWTYQDEFVINTLTLIKAHPSNPTTSVSPAVWALNAWDGPTHAAVANNAMLDVLGTHIYGYFTTDIEGICNNAQTITTGYKPIIVDEAGFVGNGAAYPDTLNLVSKVPSTFTGNPSHAQGVGFCLFQAFVGNIPWYVTGQHPYVLGDGLLYNPFWDNGTTKYARDYTNPTTIASLVTVAAMHGVTVTPPAITPMPSSHPAYVPGLPMPDGWHHPHFDFVFQNSWPTFGSVAEVDFAAAVMSGVSIFSFLSFENYAPNIIAASHKQDMLNAYVFYHAWRSGPNPNPNDPVLQGHINTWWVETAFYWTQLGTLYP